MLTSIISVRPINRGRTDYEFVSPRTGFPGVGKGLNNNYKQNTTIKNTKVWSYSNV